MSDQELLPHNPFPGPQPYRAGDRERFFGREALIKKLLNQVLAHPSTTLFGPSGAGKSSLMQAGVIPLLLEEHDFRVVRVDGWPPGEAPLEWLVEAIFSDLELGLPGEAASLLDRLDEAMALAKRRSDRPILIYLDQLEQLLFPGRAAADVGALIEGVDRLARAPLQGLQMVLSLREDYLGRFRDRTRGRKELLAHGFRLGPLTVGEMVKAVCRAAAEGEPAQAWSEAQTRALMLEVRVPGQSASDEAEVQAAFGQIVCRALWEERSGMNRRKTGVVEAEAILQRYLEAIVEGLGDQEAAAQQLLEEHLIDAEGQRTLLTEKQAGLLLPGKAAEVLGWLERAAILHAEEHQGSRYFELGHDWLAKRVFERRSARQQREAERRRRKKEAETRTRERAARRRLAVIAGLALSVAAGMGGVVIWALQQRARAHTVSLMVGARGLLGHGLRGLATQLLLEVDEPGNVHGWTTLAADVLAEPMPLATLRGQRIVAAAWSPDGKRIVAASLDGTAKVWNADGTGAPVVLKGHSDGVLSAAWSPDGRCIATVSMDKTARVWNADGSGAHAIVLKGHEGDVLSAAWSPDGARVVTVSKDKTARVWNAEGSGVPLVLMGHMDWVVSAAWSPDGKRIVTASDDKTARVWSAEGDRITALRGHEDKVLSAAWSPDGTRIVTASRDKTARIWTNLERVTIQSLTARLREATTDCLPPEQRSTYLGEGKGRGRDRYEACERLHGRTPLDPDGEEF